MEYIINMLLALKLGSTITFYNETFSQEGDLMTHWFEYSIGAVHIKNAKDCVEKMKRVTLKDVGFNYGKEEKGVFLMIRELAF